MPKLLPDYTSVSTLRMCPRKFFHAFEQNLQSRERVPLLVAGSAMHAGLEVWYKTSDLDAAEQALRESWGDFTIPPTASHSYLTPTHLSIVLRNYAEAHEDRPRQIVKTGQELFGEKAFELSWDGTTVGGIIDLVEETDSGQRYLVDFKCSSGWINSYWASRRGFDLGHQLRLYTIAVEELLGEPVAGAYVEGIYMGEKATEDRDWSKQKSDPWRLFGPFTWSEAELDETRAWFETAIEEVGWRRQLEQRLRRKGRRPEDAWPQNTLNAFSCPSCEFYQLCDASPTVRDGLAKARYITRKPTGRLLSGADGAD